MQLQLYTLPKQYIVHPCKAYIMRLVIPLERHCCVFSNGRVKSAASSDVPKRNDREIQEVLPMVEDLSVQAQLHGSASTSGEGGKQGEKTFPSVQAQLDEIRPLVNARLQEGTTW